MWKALHGLPKWNICPQRRVYSPLGKSMEEEKYDHITLKMHILKKRRSRNQKFIIIVLLELVSVAGYIETRYTCCQGDLGAEGCQVAKVKQAIDK